MPPNDKPAPKKSHLEVVADRFAHVMQEPLTSMMRAHGKPSDQPGASGPIDVLRAGYFTALAALEAAAAAKIVTGRAAIANQSTIVGWLVELTPPAKAPAAPAKK